MLPTKMGKEQLVI